MLLTAEKEQEIWLHLAVFRERRGLLSAREAVRALLLRMSVAVECASLCRPTLLYTQPHQSVFIPSPIYYSSVRSPAPGVQHSARDMSLKILVSTGASGYRICSKKMGTKEVIFHVLYRLIKLMQSTTTVAMH